MVSVPDGDHPPALRENPRLSPPDVAVLALTEYADWTAVADAVSLRRIARMEGIDARGTAHLLLEPVRDRRRRPEAGLRLIDALLESGWNPEPGDYAAVIRTLDRIRE